MDQVGNPLTPGGGGKHDSQDKEVNHDHDLIQEHDQTEEQQLQEVEEEEEYDRYKDNPELLGETKSKATRMFSYDW